MSRCRTIGRWIAVAVLALPSLASAQLAMVGTVRDDDGAPLPGVTVEARSEALDGARIAFTNEEGTYRFVDLPPGNYSLAFSLPGFADFEREIELTAGRSSRVDVELEPEEWEETILVTADRSLDEAFWVLRDRCDELSAPAEDAAAGAPEPGYRPICFLGKAAYAFNAPAGLRYLEEEDLLFRLDPIQTPLELWEDVEKLGLRGSVEAGRVAWSRCMEAELVETTIDSELRARDLNRSTDEPKIEIRPLVREVSDLGVEEWVEAESGEEPVGRRLGLHPTDWRWRIRGIRPGRTQLSLRLYAVAVLADSEPGNPVCSSRLAGEPDSSRRVRTLQRRLAIEVSAAQWVESELPSPWLWSLLLPPAGLVLAWWRHRRGKPVLTARRLESGR